MRYRVSTSHANVAEFTCIVGDESLKLVCCFLALQLISPSVRLVDPKLALLALLSALCYTLQKRLQLLALQYITATSYQILSQGKLVATACISCVFLGRRFNRRQILGLSVIVAGFILSVCSNTDMRLDFESYVGSVCMAFVCILSGTAAVITEKLLHTGRSAVISILKLNVYLSVYSLCALLMSSHVSGEVPRIDDILAEALSYPTGLIIVLQAVGGLLCAVVVRYLSSVAKVLAVSTSIGLTSLVSKIVLHDDLTLQTLCSGAIVIGGIVQYNT